MCACARIGNGRTLPPVTWKFPATFVNWRVPCNRHASGGRSGVNSLNIGGLCQVIRQIKCVSYRANLFGIAPKRLWYPDFHNSCWIPWGFSLKRKLSLWPASKCCLCLGLNSNQVASSVSWPNETTLCPVVSKTSAPMSEKDGLCFKICCLFVVLAVELTATRHCNCNVNIQIHFGIKVSIRNKVKFNPWVQEVTNLRINQIKYDDNADQRNCNEIKVC